MNQPTPPFNEARPFKRFAHAKGSALNDPDTNWKVAMALVVLSPILSELLTGTTRLTAVMALLPQMGTWGCAALVIREVARRLNLSFSAILWMGLAFAILEELLVLQTSLAPMVGVKPRLAYGRAGGVNWVYLVWALGFKTIWCVAIPVKLVELAQGSDTKAKWLSHPMLVAAAAVTLGSFAYSWRSWVKVLVPKFFPKSVYHIQWQTVLVALGLIGIALWIALKRRSKTIESPEQTRPAEVAPWQAAVLAFLITVPWSGLLLLAYGNQPKIPYGAALTGAAMLLAQSIWLGRRWFTKPNWSDQHQLAVVTGALLSSMLTGFGVLKVAGVALNSPDVIGKLLLNLAALVGLFQLSRTLAGRNQAVNSQISIEPPK